jgi:Skp family chaperone for outer membrane proteins
MKMLKSNWRTLDHLLPWALAAGTICLLLAGPARSADPPASGPLKIGIANIQTIVQSIHEYQDLTNKMSLDRKALTDTMNTKKNDLTAMQQALSYLKVGTPQYQTQEDKYLNASIEFDAWVKETQLDLDRKQKDAIKQLFVEIQDAVAQVAQQDGLNLVINDERPALPDDLESLTVDQLRQIISQRTVLFSDQSNDISQQVVTLMDKNYAAKTAATPAPAPATH